MAWQINTMHETPLPRAIQAAAQEGGRSSLLTFVFLLVLALVIDSIVWYARRKGWTLRGLQRGLYIAALPMLLVISTIGLATFHEQGARQVLSTSQRLGGFGLLGLATVLISLVLIPVGALVGLWIGQIMGQLLQAEAK